MFRGRKPKENNHPFPLMLKGERKIRSISTGGEKDDRGSMSIVINDKQGYCWKIGCH
jgi:hypothetical protein